MCLDPVAARSLVIETQAGGNRIQGHLSRGGPESRTFQSKVTRGLHPVPSLTNTLCVCFFVLCNRHSGWFNKTPGPDPRGTEMEVTYLPSAFSSDSSYADLPLPLLGAPVDIEALVKLGSRSLAKQDRD